MANRSIATLLAVTITGCATDGGQDAESPSLVAIPTASAASDEPTVASSPSVHPLRDPDIDSGVPEVLEPGTYVLDRLPVDLVFDIPNGNPPGWHAGRSSADAAVVLWFTPPQITYAFSFWNVDNVYVDPCDAAAGEVEPPVGPSVDELVTALSNLPRFEATAPTDVVVGAFSGKQIELTAPDSGSGCAELPAWSAGEDSYSLAPGEQRSVRVLDVNGVRLVLFTREPEQPDPATSAELEQILDSIRIEPLS